MKLLAYFFTVLIVFCSIANTSYAYEENELHSANTSITIPSIIENNHLYQLLAFNDLTHSLNNTIFTFEQNIFESKPQIQGKFSAGRVSIETGLMQSQQASNWSKYYFNGAIILHQKNAFNLSLTASIEQLKNINLNYYQTPVLESVNNSHNVDLNYSYGLIGSYSINSTWHFSGGIIHSSIINDMDNDILYNNTHMALVGTTYSF